MILMEWGNHGYDVCVYLLSPTPAAAAFRVVVLSARLVFAKAILLP